MIIKNKNILIYGMGKTGESLAVFVHKHGGNVYVFDKEKREYPELFGKIKEDRSGKHKKEVIVGIDYIILSPGVPPKNEVINFAIKTGVAVFSEMDFALSFACGTKIGVSGSLGKSTTCKVISQMLEQKYPDVRLCGNFGTPICDVVENSTPNTIFVVEVSSFMLETSKSFHFDVAVLTNVEKNHLDRHKTMAEYTKIKCKLSKNMQAPDVIVAKDSDGKILRELKRNAKSNHSPKLITFRGYKDTNQDFSKAENYIKDGELYAVGGKVLDSSSLQEFGWHVLENFLVASIVARLFGVEQSDMQVVAENFAPLQSRFQKVWEKDGISYIDDSKSTSAKSAQTSVDMIKAPAVLLIGGADKKDDFLPLFKAISENHFVTKAVVFGRAKERIAGDANFAKYHGIIKADNLEKAFEVAVPLAVSGGSVILIPACPSHDEFENFEKRAERFVELAKGGES